VAVRVQQAQHLGSQRRISFACGVERGLALLHSHILQLRE
jgi:hypothetical protein